MADSSLSLVVDEAELLNEHQLLEFYHNDRLEIIDDFIDSFHKVTYLHIEVLSVNYRMSWNRIIVFMNY